MSTALPPGLDAEIVSLVGVYDFARMNQVLIIYHVRSKNAAQPIVLDPNEIAAHRLVAPHRLQPWQVQNGAPLSALADLHLCAAVKQCSTVV